MMLWLTLVFACKKPETDPTLSSIGQSLVREFDEPTLVDHITDLRTWLADDWDPEIEGYEMESLREEDVAHLERPNRDISLALGGAVAMKSSFGLEEHTVFVMREDQYVVDPDDYPKFDRTLTEGADCFAGQGCDYLGTWNEIIKRGAFNVEIPYNYDKPYRWVDTGDALTLIAQGAIPEEAWAEGGGNGVRQSYNLDIFTPFDGGLVRVHVQWIELAFSVDGVFSDDQIVKQTIDGIVEVIEDTDEAIAEGR